MKKLTLDPETLRVETFEVKKEAEPRGTVHGRGSSAYIACQFDCFTGRANCDLSGDLYCTGRETCSGWTAWQCPTDENTCGG